jgi:hypothetical protein
MNPTHNKPMNYAFFGDGQANPSRNKARGRAVLYEVCGNKNTPLHFPVPWAQDSSMSFLVPPAVFCNVMTSAGFDTRIWSDKTVLAQKVFAGAKETMGEPDLPILAVYLLVGEGIQIKVYNLHRNLDEERVSLIEALGLVPRRLSFNKRLQRINLRRAKIAS